MDDKDREEIRKEIAEARRIILEDAHKSELKGIRAKLDKHFPETDPPEGDPPSDPNVPPPPDPKDPANNPPPKPKSRWWGDALDAR